MSDGTFGSGAAALSDLDGDFVPDYAVFDPTGNSNTGTVELYSGATGATLFTIQGNGTGTFGEAISDAGDVNGDEIHDLLVGDPNSVAANATETVTTRGVPAGNLIGVAVVDVSGTPMFQFIALAAADATEAISFQ